MCGIAGLLEPSPLRSDDERGAILRAMADTMWFRGPDGSGEWTDPETGVGFSHRRLSILDLSEHGAQPMESADGRYVITYNGEIYNHEELAADLRSGGVRLRGHSDTEILLETVARYGLRHALERVDGMFAIGLWDRRDRVLSLARDRMGEKPLYYGRLGGGEVVFGSTLDAVSAHPKVERRVDRQSLALFLRHKYVPGPRSIYLGISKLEPGTLLEVRPGEPLGEPEPYWSYLDVVSRGATFDGSPGEAADELDRLLRRSISRRMVADVPVGAFLSGGIDSSTVVAIAQQESSQPVRTFTIGSSDRDYDESSDAAAVASHLGCDHTELIVTDEDALAMVDRLGAIWDEPFADSSQVPTTLVSELARNDVTVALSGDGGDELFVGYNRYVWVPSIWKALSKVPVGPRRPLAAAMASVPPAWLDRAAGVLPENRRPRMLGLKVAKVAGVADAADPEDVYHRLVSHWQDPSQLMPGVIEPPTVHTDATQWPRTDNIVEHMAAIDAVTYLPDDVLTKVDRATMSVSLESRVPLLDRSILEFAAGLPADIKLHDGESKWPLREVLRRYVPADFLDRPKSGFGVPIEGWLRGPLKGWAEEHLFGATSREHFEQAPIRKAWQQFLAGRRNSSYELWDVIMFSVWAESRL